MSGNKNTFLYYWLSFLSFISFVSILLLTSQSVAQVGYYAFEEDLEAYTDINLPYTVAYGEIGVGYNNHTNGNTHLAEIGFNFVYDGNSYSQCYISTNGFLTFGAQQPNGNLYTPISSNVVYSGAISAFGQYIRSDTDQVVYKTTGAAPNRVFIIQWKNIYRNADALKRLFNFQIKLFETTNTIEFHYGVCNPDNETPIGVQVGLRGPDNIIAQGNINNRLQNNSNGGVTWALNTLRGTANNHSLRTSSTEYPDNGLIFRYVPPPPCVNPSGSLQDFVIGSTNVTLTAFSGNSFSAGTSTATNYLVLRSLVNVPPTPAQIPNRTFFSVNNIIDDTYRVISISNSTTFNQTSLDSNTTYYYWVIPYNVNCLGGPFYHHAGIISASNTTCIAAPVLNPITTFNGNGFTASWSAVAGANDYSVQVSLNPAFTNLVPGFESISSGGATSIAVTGLQPLTLYYVRVKAIGNGPCSINSNTSFFNSPCGFYTIPYSQSFDTTPVNNVPGCYVVNNENGDANLWSVQALNPASAPRSLYLNTNSLTLNDDWFFMPGLLLTGGTDYTLSFKLNTGTDQTFNERLRIRLGTSATVAGMNLTLEDYPILTNTIYQEYQVTFSVASTGVYYLGFQAYSAPNQSYIVIDDILVDFSPSCYVPENVSLLNVTVNSAEIEFEEPFNVPSLGYEYFLSTSQTPPSLSTVPTGSIPVGETSLLLPGLTPSTQYFLWIRGNCGADDKSEWSIELNFSTECDPPQVLNVINGGRCGVGSVALQATPNSGAIIEWFNEINGSVVGTGQSFNTPALSTSTTYYARAKSSGSIRIPGPKNLNSIPGSRIVQTESIGTNLLITEETTLLSFDIFPVVSGQSGLIVFRNSLGSAVFSQNFTTTTVGGITPQTIPINFDFLPGNYTITIVNMPGSGLITNSENVLYPYTSSVATLSGNNFDNSLFSCLYNWKFTSTCYSGFEPVTATISSPPALTLSSVSEVICSGDSTTTITLIGAGSYNVFNWFPSTGVSGNAATGFVFNPTESTNYVLTAQQTTGFQCVINVSFSVTVNPSPPGITIIPDSADLCEGTVQAFSATFGATSEINIFVENFEGDLSGWSITNSSTGGNLLASQWTLRSSPYTYNSAYWNLTINSNDASNFFFANSDAQGSPSSNFTRTYLTSPSFSLDGYTSASFSFWHFLRWIVTNRAQAEISIDDGASWELLQAYTGIQGGASNFTNSVINLDAYVGNPQVRLRFYYEATWDYGWAIDNLRVYGTVSTAVNWTPADDLYMDELATIPYVEGTPTGTVYCLPTADRNYTARVNTIDGCFSEATFSVGFSPQPIGGTIPAGEALCVGGTPANLTLSGYSGNIIRWESADDEDFKINVTPIAFTSDVLTPAQMGVITTIKYFRAVLGSGVCPVAYSNVAGIGFPTTVWNGTVWNNGEPDPTTQAVINVSGAATINTDIEACTLQVVSGAITVASGVTLNLQGTVTVSGGSLTFENEASLVQVDPTPNTGSITYRRDSQPMWLYDYTYWSSPVAAQNVKNFSPNTNWLRFYTYQGGVNWQQVFPNQAAFAAGTATMTPGQGVIIRAPGSGVPQFYAFGNPAGPTVYPGVFTGVPNNGTYTAPINISVDNVFNLIGNPYPSAIDIHEFLLDPVNDGVIERTVYLWTHNTPITNNVYNDGDYATYNFMGGVTSDPGTGSSAPNGGGNNNAPTRYLASGQGFIVYGQMNGTVRFTNAMRVGGNNTSFFRMANEEEALLTEQKYRLWLNMTNHENLNQQLMVGFHSNASGGLDDGYDSKSPSSGYGLRFYSLLDELPLSIQAKGLPFDVAETFPLGYQTATGGTYTIALSDWDAFFGSQEVYLEDMLLGVIHDLKAGPYSFITEGGLYHQRFRVRFTNETLGVDSPSYASNVVVFQQAGSLTVQAVQQGFKEIKGFDVTGRLLFSRSALNGSQLEVFETQAMARQAILLQITNQEGKVQYVKTVLK